MSDKLELRFKKQQFQVDAADAVVGVFDGQPFFNGANFKVDLGEANGKLDFSEGFGNLKIRISSDQLLSNLKKIQREHQIKPLDKMPSLCQLTVEMETGTGKTYTYIKTMYELNKKYGWSKFIVVVPSIAIREGVAKSFEITAGHFREEYGKTIRSFVYNSKRLNEIDHFATSPDIYAMIVNSQAFNAKGKDARRIYMELDDFASRRPIDVLAATNPILIIDEPQSVEGKKTAESLNDFKPLFILRYSATPKKETKPYTVYRLDAKDAYDKKLVKKITVKGFTVEGNTAANGYIYLQRINLSKLKAPTATIEFDQRTSSGVKKIIRTVSDIDKFNLFDQSNGLDEYKDGWIITQINGADNSISFLNGKKIYVGEIYGEIDEDYQRRLQIRETIASHLERERFLFSKGIKVLSLFFIDEVAKYRCYDECDDGTNGIYAKIFEEEYQNAVDSLEKDLFASAEYYNYLAKISAHNTHAGYFSIDKKKHFVDSAQNKEGISDDESAYDLIMKDKERLLSFSNDVRFIFSHSALREGWDNPNVFQICTLKQSIAGDKKRQEIGRGMRLCVNQDGERMDEIVLGRHEVHSINTLTVIANESYEDFAKKLQTEIAEVLNDRPVKVDKALFIGKTLDNVEIDDDMAQNIIEKLIKNDYVEGGQLTDKFYADKENNSIDLGEAFEGKKEEIVKILDTVYDAKRTAPENERKNNVSLLLDEEKLARKEFQNLWKHINGKTHYTVSFDTDELIRKCINALDVNLNVSVSSIKIEQGSLSSIKSKEDLIEGSAFKKEQQKIEKTSDVSSSLKYDLIGKIVDETGLTRNAILQILQGIKPVTFSQFKQNPEDFIIKTSRIINDEKASTIIEHIVYNKLGEVYNDKEIFAEPNIKGCLNKNAMEVKKHLYDYLVYDSKVEYDMAKELDAANEVAVYVKLPKKFFINTPLGKYNPDWAIAFHEGSVKHIFFVAETKGSISELELRPIEHAKITCARKHFEILNDGEYVYDVVETYKDLLDKVMK